MSKRPAHTLAAFTLVELLISLALILLLMLGVSRIFQMVSQAIGASNAITTILQNSRSIESNIAYDFAAVSGTNMPFLIIQNQQQTAFMDAQDQSTDKAYNTTPNEPNIRNVNGTIISPAIYNARSHRCDRIGFFAAGKYHTLTGLEVNNAPFISAATSREAYIWYGHVQLGNGANPQFVTDASNIQEQWPGLPLPGMTPTSGNSNNFYARSWALGRQVVLLANPIPQNPASSPLATYTGYIQYTANATFNASPLNSSDLTTVPSATAPVNYQNIVSARFDLAQTSMATLLTQCEQGWTSTSFSLMNYRFQCVPAVAKPITPATLSTTLPLWAPHCSSVIIEFAGDFLNQNPDGTLINTAGNPSNGWEGQDGVTDFYIDPITKQRKIRWYGLPRDINNDNQILGKTAVACPTKYATTAKYDPNQLVDVVPLRDVLETADTTITAATIETTWGATGVITPQKADYAAAGSPMDAFYWISGANNNYGQYYTGWRAGLSTPRPTLIRFIITLEDPSGQAAGRSFEYVVTLN